MKVEIYMVIPPEVMTQNGSYLISEIQGSPRPGLFIDTETMKVVAKGPANEECSV